MLKTEVLLNFPNASRAEQWVPISCLLPTINMRNIASGEVLASSTTIEDRNDFQALRQKLSNGQYPASSTELETSATGGNAEEGSLYCVQVDKAFFLAFIEVEPYQGRNEDFEIHRLRDKRLRLFQTDDAIVEKRDLFTDGSDHWIQRLQEVC